MLELKGGGKRPKWKEISKNNEWYIDETFLLRGKKLSNPTRLSENNVRAYWRHWFHLAKSGQHFTFKKVGDYRPDNKNGSSEDKDDDDEEDNLSDDGEQEGGGGTPKNCKSDKEKISLLHSLLPQYEYKNHSLITIVASMEVGSTFEASVHTLTRSKIFRRPMTPTSRLQLDVSPGIGPVYILMMDFILQKVLSLRPFLIGWARAHT